MTSNKQAVKEIFSRCLVSFLTPYIFFLFLRVRELWISVWGREEIFHRVARQFSMTMMSSNIPKIVFFLVIIHFVWWCVVVVIRLVHLARLPCVYSQRCFFFADKSLAWFTHFYSAVPSDIFSMPCWLPPPWCSLISHIRTQNLTFMKKSTVRHENLLI